jgi:hypothetical protein
MNDLTVKTAVNVGWVKGTTPPRKERIERNPAVVVAVASLSLPQAEPKPISEHKTTVVLGVHRSATLNSLLKEARNREEIREIIDQANKDNPSPEEFEKRLIELRDAKAVKEEVVITAKRGEVIDLVPLRFQKALSELKLAIAQAFSDADQKLAQEMKETAAARELKDRLEKRFENLIKRLKEHKIVRTREENLLVDANITQVLRIK